MKRTKIVPLLLAMCFCMFGCGTVEGHFEEQQALKQEGMELQSTGDYAGAIEKYEEALRLANMTVGPAEIDLAYYKASAQYRSGDLAGAIDTYSKIIALKEDVNSHLGRGLLYVVAKDAENAEKDLNKALNDTDDPLIKGIIYNTVNETEKAKEYFEKAKEEGDSEAIFYLANIYEKAGDHNYAMILLEEYIASGKASAEGHLSVARNCMELEDYDAALETLQTGIALGESGVLKNLMQEEIACYEKMGDFATAKLRAEDYLNKYPDDEIIKKEYEFLKSR